MAPTRPNSPPVDPFDHPLEFLIPSRSRPGEVHKCELRAYGRNGECSCEDFNFNFRKFLVRGITAAQALEQGLVKIRKGHDPRDCLRCDHIIEGFRQAGENYVRMIDEAETAHEKKHSH